MFTSDGTSTFTLEYMGKHHKDECFFHCAQFGNRLHPQTATNELHNEHNQVKFKHMLDGFEQNLVELGGDFGLKVIQQTTHKTCCISFLAGEVFLSNSMHGYATKRINLICPIYYCIEVLLKSFQHAV